MKKTDCGFLCVYVGINPVLFNDITNRSFVGSWKRIRMKLVQEIRITVWPLGELSPFRQ